MRRVLCLALTCVVAFGCFCTNTGAADVPTLENTPEESVIMRASGSFNISVGAYKKTAADTVFPLAAEETVRIRANYAPEDASMDFGLIDSKGGFHYVNVTTGSIDATIKIPENGNYTLAIINNSGNTVKVSGIVNY